MDESESKMVEFCCEYPFDGATYACNVVAIDKAEASRRLRAIGMNGVVLGELVERIPAHTPSEAALKSKWRLRLNMIRSGLSLIRAAFGRMELR